jgi:hypothetical protein
MPHQYSTTEVPAFDVSHDDAPARGPHDLEKLVRLAEWLSDKCERYRTRTTWLFHYATGLGGAVLTAAGLVWAFMDPDSPLRMALTGAILGSASAVASVSVVYYLHVRHRLNQDQKALAEVGKLLSGPAGDVAARDDLSPVEQAVFRIRIARLDDLDPASRRGLLGRLAAWLRKPGP